MVWGWRGYRFSRIGLWYPCVFHPTILHNIWQEKWDVGVRHSPALLVYVWLSHLGYGNKPLQCGWLRQQDSISHSSGEWLRSSRSSCRLIWFLVKVFFSATLSLYCHITERERVSRICGIFLPGHYMNWIVSSKSNFLPKAISKFHILEFSTSASGFVGHNLVPRNSMTIFLTDHTLKPALVALSLKLFLDPIDKLVFVSHFRSVLVRYLVGLFWKLSPD